MVDVYATARAYFWIAVIVIGALVCVTFSAAKKKDDLQQLLQNISNNVELVRGAQGKPGQTGVPGAIGATGPIGQKGEKGERGETPVIDTSKLIDALMADENFKSILDDAIKGVVQKQDANQPKQ